MGQRVFKTEPQYPPVAGDENDARFMQSLVNFFKQPWGPGTRPSETYGYVYTYDEQGSLTGEYGMGGAHSTGSKQYVYLPTAAGPMPIVAMTGDTRYAVLADHLNTPRRVTHPDGGLMWQWGYSAFGDEQPTVAGRRFNKVAALESDFSINLRYPGQYFDVESGLHYNGFRTYNPTVGRYTQGDPIGLDGGWNRFGYVNGSPLLFTDPMGLMGRGSGVYGTPGSGAPAGGSNASIGGGFSFHTPLGVGIGMDGGLARDTNGNTCVYSMICYTLGPGMSAGAGPVTSIGSGPLSTGTTDYQGACWTGGSGLVGSGSVLFGNDGSAQTGRGMGGVGGGVSGTYQSCRQQLLCARN